MKLLKTLRILGLIFFFSLQLNLLAQSKIEKELGKLYQQKNYKTLFSKADSILQKTPNHAMVNLIRGRALVDQGKRTEGKPFIEKAIKYDKDNSWIKAWGLNYLGRIELFNDNREVAKIHLENCLKMDATKNVNKASKGLLLLSGMDAFYVDWTKVETEHFLFHFQQNTLVTDVKQFAKRREDAFVEINKFFKSEIPKKIDFIVWNGNEDAKEIGIKSLGFARPVECIIHSRFTQTRGHEITHVIVRDISKLNSRTRFINEGIAVAFDLTKDNKLDVAKKIKNEEGFDGLVSISEAWDNSTKYSEWVYYPLAGEFIKRIIEKGGKEKFLKLVANQDYTYATSLYGNVLTEVIENLEKEIN